MVRHNSSMHVYNDVHGCLVNKSKILVITCLSAPNSLSVNKRSKYFPVHIPQKGCISSRGHPNSSHK